MSGAVTRNVGVKVLDGTEDWRWKNYLDHYFTITTAQSDMPRSLSYLPGYSNMFSVVDSSSVRADNTICLVYARFSIRYDTANGDVNAFKQYLADQYAAGTPVIIVYPLATPTTEQVTPQPLTGNTVTQTAGSISNMDIDISYLHSLIDRYVGDTMVNKVYIGDNLVHLHLSNDTEFVKRVTCNGEINEDVDINC